MGQTIRKIFNKEKPLSCDKCKQPVEFTEGFTEKEKQDFLEVYELTELLCERCAPQEVKSSDEIAAEIKEFFDELYEELKI